MCVSLIILPHSFLILRALQTGKVSSHNTAVDTTQRPAPIRAPCLTYFPHPPAAALDGTAAPVRDPFPIILTPDTLDRDHIVVPVG
jgi:hypothetical protein